jgi:hypothetical protein
MVKHIFINMGEKMNTSQNDKQSLHRPAWTQHDLEAFNHLHLPVRNKHRKVVAPIKKNHSIIVTYNRYSQHNRLQKIEKILIKILCTLIFEVVLLVI